MSTDMVHWHALSQENAVLVRELSRVQERVTRVMSEKTAEIAQLQIQNAFLRQRLERAAVPSRTGLQWLRQIGLLRPLGVPK